MATTKLRFLERRRLRWYVILDVPVKARPIIGQKRLVASTKTEDLAIAMVRRDAKLREWRAKIAEALQTNADPVLAEALEIRNAPLSLYPAQEADPDEPFPLSDEDLKAEDVLRRAERVEAAHGEAQAQAFVAVALGKDDTIRSMFDQWQREGHVQPKERANRETVIKVFLAWLVVKKVVPTVRSVTRALAGQFVSEELIPRSRATAAKYLSTLRGLWKWLESKGVVKDFPWDRHSLPKRQLSRDEKKRAFTDEEVVKLLTGPATPTMHDMMMVAALSGMRLEEIASLRIKDVSKGGFDIPLAKTLAGQRSVPIHSKLVALVERRSKGKGPDDRLFSDISSESKLGKHAVAFSKAFTNYRRSIGVNEVPGDARTSVVNFHSWRHWFITTAVRAGVPLPNIQAVVGHKHGNITLDVYARGAAFELAGKCVEAVKLPRLPARSKSVNKRSRG